MSGYDNGTYTIIANPVGTPGPEGFPWAVVTLPTALGSIFVEVVKDPSKNITKNQKWILQNIDGGRFILESVAFPGYFASVYFPDSGAALTGLSNATPWTAVRPQIPLPGVRILAAGGNTPAWFLPDSTVDQSVSLQGSNTTLQGTESWAIVTVPA